MKIIILNKEDAKEISPLAYMLADTGREITTLCGMKVYSDSNVEKGEGCIVERHN